MFKKISESMIVRVADGMCIPLFDQDVLGNKDIAAYKIWLAAGNTPQPADIIHTPPNWQQFRKVLFDNPTYSAAIASLNNHKLRRLEQELSLVSPDPNQVKKYWDAVIGGLPPLARPESAITNWNALCAVNFLPFSIGVDGKIILL